MTTEATTRRFHLGAILSVMTEILVCEIADVHELLDFMTGDALFTHQLPRANDECAPALRRQFPDLATVTYPEDSQGREAALAWLAEQVRQHGTHRDVAPLAAEDHTRIDPLSELAMMAPHLSVIPVVLPKED